MLIIIRFVSISAYSDPDSAVSNNIYGKTWVLYYSLIPSLGSRIALAKDKQLEIAHAVIYCRNSLHLLYIGRHGYNTSHCERSSCVSSCTLNLRDSHIEDNVRKRPFTNKVMTLSPFAGLTEPLQRYE